MPGRTPRPWRRGLVLFNLLALVGIVALTALGVWQVQRRTWKHELIARVEARVTEPPTALPGPDEWPALRDEAFAYRHVRLAGTFLHDRSTLVQALTALGGGYWVLTPLRTDAGFTVLVNRGFVPSDRRDPSTWTQPPGTVALTGLLRASEPGGAFLRSNDPAADRWYARDVAAIAKARDLGPVAPYFVDADAKADDASLPVGGLTVVSFADNHLVYALTWFALAAMLLAALVYVNRQARPWTDTASN